MELKCYESKKLYSIIVITNSITYIYTKHFDIPVISDLSDDFLHLQSKTRGSAFKQFDRIDNVSFGIRITVTWSTRAVIM
jgi:hypothetical protein